MSDARDERDDSGETMVLSWFLELLAARKRRQPRKAAEAREQLRRLGVYIEFGPVPREVTHV